MKNKDCLISLMIDNHEIILYFAPDRKHRSPVLFFIFRQNLSPPKNIAEQYLLENW